MGTGTVPAAVQQALDAAQTDYTKALAALAAGSLGEYQTDVIAMQGEINTAEAAAGRRVADDNHDDGSHDNHHHAAPRRRPNPPRPRPPSRTTTTTLATAAGQSG